MKSALCRKAREGVLTVADAFHLAAWKLHASHLEFVCLDRRLSAAALAEGATVLP